MLALRDLQAAFAAHLKGEDRPDLAEAVMGDTISAAARLRIHRHHVRQSLVGALASTFPTVQAIVGEAESGQPVLQRRMESQVQGPIELGHVGEVGQRGCRPVSRDEGREARPVLGQHRLRRQLAQDETLRHGPEERLADLPAERLFDLKPVLAAGSTLLRSPYPIDRIWHASQPGATVGTVSLEEGPASVLVLRRPDDAAFASLDSAEEAFLGAIVEGSSLGEAAQAAVSVEPAADPSRIFARLLALEAFAALQHER